MVPVFPPFAIISASVASTTYEVNLARNKALAAMLRATGLTVHDVEGTFQGIPEPSLLVFGISERSALGIARDYSQTHILMVDAMRHAALVATIDGSRQYVGQWRETPEAIGDYTSIDGKRYSCVVD